MAVENGDPINLEKAIAFWSDNCAAFSIAVTQALILLLVPLKVSVDVKAACIIVCFIIMDDR